MVRSNQKGIEMFWPVVLPLQITLGILVGVLVLALAFATKRKWKVGKTLGITLIVSSVAFIPTCTGIMKILDPYRFGVFEYETATDVSDKRVRHWLPVSAKAITVDQQHNGFRANFTISQKELDEHLDQQWARNGKESVSARDENHSGQPVDVKMLEREFGGLKWQFFDDVIEYQGPVAGNGAGYSIWFSPSQAVAYQSGGYW